MFVEKINDLQSLVCFYDEIVKVDKQLYGFTEILVKIKGLRVSIHHLLDFLLSAELLLFYCMTGLTIYYTKEWIKMPRFLRCSFREIGSWNIIKQESIWVTLSIYLSTNYTWIYWQSYSRNVNWCSLPYYIYFPHLLLREYNYDTKFVLQVGNREREYILFSKRKL